MKRFHTFVAGQDVPKWMFGISYKNRNSMFKSRSHKITFGTSCICVSEDGKMTGLMPVNNTANKSLIIVRNAYNCIVGSVNNATGIATYCKDYSIGGTLVEVYPDGLPDIECYSNNITNCKFGENYENE